MINLLSEPSLRRHVLNRGRVDGEVCRIVVGEGGDEARAMCRVERPDEGGWVIGYLEGADGGEGALSVVRVWV